NPGGTDPSNPNPGGTDPNNPNPGGTNPNNPDPNPNPNPNPGNPGDNASKGPLETTLNNTGAAVDSILPVGLGDTLGGVGTQLDTVVGPVAGTITDLTQTVGAETGLGEPVAGLLGQVGTAVSNVG